MRRRRTCRAAPPAMRRLARWFSNGVRLFRRRPRSTAPGAIGTVIEPMTTSSKFVVALVGRRRSGPSFPVRDTRTLMERVGPATATADSTSGTRNSCGTAPDRRARAGEPSRCRRSGRRERLDPVERSPELFQEVDRRRTSIYHRRIRVRSKASSSQCRSRGARPAPIGERVRHAGVGFGGRLGAVARLFELGLTAVLPLVIESPRPSPPWSRTRPPRTNKHGRCAPIGTDPTQVPGRPSHPSSRATSPPRSSPTTRAYVYFPLVCATPPPTTRRDTDELSSTPSRAASTGQSLSSAPQTGVRAVTPGSRSPRISSRVRRRTTPRRRFILLHSDVLHWLVGSPATAQQKTLSSTCSGMNPSSLAHDPMRYEIPLVRCGAPGNGVRE